VTGADGDTVISDETTVIDANSSLSNPHSNEDTKDEKPNRGGSHSDSNDYEGSEDEYNEESNDEENYDEGEEVTPKATDKAWMSDPNDDSPGQTSMRGESGATALDGEDEGMMSIQTVPNPGQESGVDMMDSIQ